MAVAACEDEWKEAAAKYKALSADSEVNYLRRTATASINIETDACFNNDRKISSGDLRGGKQTDSLYDTFPGIEADAKAFVVQACSQKSGDKETGDDLIRSERSCRLDLRRWGAKFEANSQRPYLEGHERDDVVKHRNEFIN
ncbi:unnamed protein product [Didymodactylos carnosus]|uniref:Uncharacterized protein n=1 Tax=Didymodactylos carnosus TaxID=1234261 RepID=A0A814V0E9_9BILA|nr:unnamed protein product [Didymodactylos carnosus]CAF3946900.1 unnamed protein product [Didymodactylos carnosus]